MRVSTAISRLQPESSLLLTSTGKLLVKDLKSLSYLTQKKFYNKKVALKLDDVNNALQSIVALDGVAKTLLLVPGDFDEKHIGLLFTTDNTDYIITDTNIACDNKIEFSDLSFDSSAVASGIFEQQTITTQWILATSGTTETPKLVIHTLASLTRATKKNIQYGADIIWGLLYDYTRFAGLQVLLQSLFGGSTLIIPDPNLSLEGKIQFLIKHHCTHLSSSPTLWRRILMSVNSERFDLRQITLGGEISDQKLLTALHSRFPNAKICHIYASTEAGVGFSVNDLKSGFPLAYLNNPPSGLEIKIIDQQLLLKNSSGPATYLNSNLSFADEQGWIATGDNVEIIGNRVYFLGRASGVINVGGNKVHPEEVELALLDENIVQQARVYAKKNPIMGELVAAEIILNDSTSDHIEIKKQLRSSLANKLKDYQIPAVISFVDIFATNPSGKLLRINKENN